MTTRYYLQPIGFCDSPQSEEGEAIRLAGGLVYACRFALVIREGREIVSRQRFSAPELRVAITSLAQTVQEQWDNLHRIHQPWQCGERTIRFDQPQVMGIVNITPDSFSDGGELMDDPEIAYAHGVRMHEAGAAIIDLGAESTRPEAQMVWEGEEINRLLPVLKRLALTGAAISVDTRKAAVMNAAHAAGAQIINDVSALRYEPGSLTFAVQSKLPIVLMHASGDGANLHDSDGYDHPLFDVYDWLEKRRDEVIGAGVAREKIMLDPGIGFGKSLSDNLALINGLAIFHSLGQPLMLGASRKRMIGALSIEADADKRLGGSIALALKGAERGVQLLRVHDVYETVQALRVWRGLRDGALIDFSDTPAN